MTPHPPSTQNGTSNAEALESLLRDMEKDGDIENPVYQRRTGEAQGARRISPWIIIPIWMLLSTGVIILNKHIFTKLHFPFPIFLTGLHMAVAACGTQTLRYTTSLLDQLKSKPVTPSQYVRTILPLGIAFSASLSLSNLAYLHLSVSFVQILKAFIPVVVHVMSCFVGLAEMNPTIATILLTVTGGCAIAAFGEIQFKLFGFVCQIFAVLIESSRLVMTHLLLGGQTYSPLSLVYLYAPLCFLLMLCLQPVFEGWSAAWAAFGNVGLPIFLLSGGLAFALNIAGVYLIESAGSTVLCLSGIVKDICLVSISVLVFSSSITPTQIVGYGIALIGLFAFKQMSASSKGSKSQSSILNSATLSKFGYPLLGIAVVAAFAGLFLKPWSRSPASGGIPAGDWSSAPGRHIYVPARGTFAMDPQGEPVSWYNNYAKEGSASLVMPDYHAIPNPSTLPRLAWVVVVSPNKVEQYASVLEHISCFCARAGIPFIVDYKLGYYGREFFTARHWHTAKYLKFYQWLIVTDADVMIADSKRDPREYIDAIEKEGDDIDVMFGDRDNGEICACVYMIKNSPGGFAFLKRWVGWGDGLGMDSNTNSDNGDLMEIMLAGTRPGLPNNADGTGRIEGLESIGEGDCINAGDHKQWTEHFVPCHWRHFYRQRTEHPLLPWWDVSLFDWAGEATTPFKARIYKMYGGFVRDSPMSNGSHGPGLQGYLEGDFLYHAQKDDRLFDVNMALCTGKDWRYQPSANVEKHKQWMHTHFAWGWPGCWDDKGVYTCSDHEAPRDHFDHQP